CTTGTCVIKSLLILSIYPVYNITFWPFVDCQASGLPHPAVRWTLPNGNTVKSELFQEDSRGQRRQRTVFHNGTLLIPAVGEGDEGEYICYAENQAGRDTMKVCNTMYSAEK
uniref:Ig-like domain-containing protein n=1 Tax=Poecilia mexicana TaxID=48701 RepID=A0A3B3WHD4_9TELE